MCKFSCFVFGNPTNKTVIGTTYRGELLIAKHLDQSLWSTNQKYSAAIRSKLFHSFLEVHNSDAPFTSHGKVHEFGAKKPISWAKPAHFDFLTIKFTFWNHILSLGGDTLGGLTKKGECTNVTADSRGQGQIVNHVGKLFGQTMVDDIKPFWFIAFPMAIPHTGNSHWEHNEPKRLQLRINFFFITWLPREVIWWNRLS